MANQVKEARKKAIGQILKLVSESQGNRLKARKAPPVVEKKGAPAPKQEEDMTDDDARRLIELYESKQGGTPEA